ncbi:hypothetical protein F2Q68_00031855 [Brassica cretica]|uniref:Uncharacterized protein n=1 Tax=Brassica cretica TaxID=69181 RepID=A0A8S9G8U6_BRACR|nr:hypothetical protein F2Q68_00031855 [Brassica cretica]
MRNPCRNLLKPFSITKTSPSPKAFLILDELSLSSIYSQLASRTATAPVRDPIGKRHLAPHHASRSSLFQLASDRPARGSLGGPVLQSSKPKGNTNSENMKSNLVVL